MSAKMKRWLTTGLVLAASTSLVLGVSSVPANAQPLPQTPGSLPAAPEIPSQQDIANAKKNQASTSAEVGKIEGLIDSGNQSLQTSMTASMKTNDAYSTALVTLQDKQGAAKDAQAKAAAAIKTSDKARNAVGQLASTIYKTGGLNPSIESFVTGGSGDVLYQASTLSMLGANRSKTFDDAKSTAATASALKDAAAQAQQAADEAAKTAETAKSQADAAVAAQNALIAKNQQQRTVLIGQLATLKNTTAALESARITGWSSRRKQPAWPR